MIDWTTKETVYWNVDVAREKYVLSTTRTLM